MSQTVPDFSTAIVTILFLLVSPMYLEASCSPWQLFSGVQIFGPVFEVVLSEFLVELIRNARLAEEAGEGIAPAFDFQGISHELSDVALDLRNQLTVSPDVKVS